MLNFGSNIFDRIFSEDNRKKADTLHEQIKTIEDSHLKIKKPLEEKRLIFLILALASVLGCLFFTYYKIQKSLCKIIIQL